MTITNDQTLVNVADTTGDWTTSDFDSPTLNNASSTTPIYIEGDECMWWPLKKGTTLGYTYEASTNLSMTGRVLVGWINYALTDVAAIPINLLRIRVSSGNFATPTNYAEWDALAQLYAPKNTPISGFTPVMAYPSNPIASSSPDYSTLDYFGWVATTGDTNDGKQGGFDMMHIIGKLVGHSETWTNTFFAALNTHANPTTIPGTDNFPLGIFSRAGDFYRTNVNIELGLAGATALTSVIETAKVVFFDNIESDHNLGYVAVNPTSYNLDLVLTNVVNFWNEQEGTSPQIITDMQHFDKILINGCSFARGGALVCRSHISDVLTYAKNSTFDDCKQVEPDDMMFEDNTIQNADAALLYDSNHPTNHRIKRTSYQNCVRAAEFDAAGTYTMDGDQFSGNTYDIHFSASTGNLIINAINGANPSALKVDNDSTGTVTINNAVTLTVTVKNRAGALVSNVQTAIYTVAGDTELMNEDTVAGVATETYNYGGTPVPVYIRTRLAPTYKFRAVGGTITAAGLNVTITLPDETVS